MSRSTRALRTGASILALALLLGYLFRDVLREHAYALLTRDMFVAVDQDDFDPGPALGSRFPGLQATYRGVPVTLLTPFAGRNGTLLIVSRSFDWCPFCMRQMIQLQEHAHAFDAAGIGLVAITYDAASAQQPFIDKHRITIPVLSDSDGLSARTLGLLNEGYHPGDAHYGVAHPGMLVVDPSGTVVGKLFLQDYRTRIDAAAALAFAKAALGLPP